MEILQTIRELRERRARWREAEERVGLVPTMGALHAGHMALVAAARRECDRVIATIFVNPKQFAPYEDLASYPRQEEDDLEELRAGGTDLAFVPPLEAIYPPGFATLVRVTGLSEGLCGAHREGHFDGVATVVTKLLLQSLPDIAYFGEKDFQQLTIIRRLARDLDIPVAISGVPTVREPDGLALSSRNVYLSPEERRIAPALARVLSEIADAVACEPDAVARELARGRDALWQAGFVLDYLEIREAADLAPVTSRLLAPSRIFAAVHLGRTRLIDNMPIERGTITAKA